MEQNMTPQLAIEILIKAVDSAYRHGDVFSMKDVCLISSAFDVFVNADGSLKEFNIEFKQPETDDQPKEK